MLVRQDVFGVDRMLKEKYELKIEPILIDYFAMQDIKE